MSVVFLEDAFVVVRWDECLPLGAQYSVVCESQGEKIFLRVCLLGTYMEGREKAGVIGYNGHFRAVINRLIKDSFLKFYKYIWILFKSGI